MKTGALPTSRIPLWYHLILSQKTFIATEHVIDNLKTLNLNHIESETLAEQPICFYIIQLLRLVQKMCTILGGHHVYQIRNHMNTDIFTALALLQALDYIRTLTLNHKNKHLRACISVRFSFLNKKGYIQSWKTTIAILRFNVLWW